MFKKTKTSDDLGWTGVAGVTGALKALFDKLHGRKSEAVYKCAGMPVDIEGAWMHEHGSQRFTLYVRLGEMIVPTSISVPTSHSALASQPMQRFGLSPDEQRLKDKEAERSKLSPLERKKENERMYEAWGLQVVQPGDFQKGAKIGSHNQKRNAPDISLF